jgi:CubicO group peptidase (beta-lactamase class C family)
VYTGAFYSGFPRFPRKRPDSLKQSARPSHYPFRGRSLRLQPGGRQKGVSAIPGGGPRLPAFSIPPQPRFSLRVQARMRRRSLRIVLLLAFLLPACFLPAAAQTPGDDLRSRLEAEVPRLLRAADVPGISVAVIRDGQIYWTGAMGVADLSSGSGVKADTVFQAASLSKPVFSYIVLRLKDRGVIDLDRPLATDLPHPRLGHDERHRRITARMVLSHTTGLPNWDFSDGPITLLFPPGESWGYSGEAFVYLQKTVEKLTGLPLDDLARREVFEPLGMSRSSFVWKPELEAAAAGVDGTGVVQQINRKEKANAAASLLTTAGDYARFLVAVLEGRGLKPETRKTWLEPRAQVVSRFGEPGSPRQPGVFWGLGWGLEQAEGPTENAVFWHWGHQDAWRAYVAVRRDGKAGLVYFANSHEGLTIAKALSDLAVGGPRPGLDWLKYERYDDPKRVARKEVERALTEGGAEAGVRRYRELRAASPKITDPEWVQALADRLMESNRGAEAAALLGQALVSIGELKPALAEYETAAKLDPAKPWPVMRKWLQEGIEAKPIAVPEETLRRLAGRYGPREITLEAGSLHYQREGRPKYRLIPIGPGLFAVEGTGSFRVRFAEDGSKLTVLQPDGEDESARTPAP